MKFFAVAAAAATLMGSALALPQNAPAQTAEQLAHCVDRVKECCITFTFNPDQFDGNCGQDDVVIKTFHLNDACAFDPNDDGAAGSAASHVCETAFGVPDIVASLSSS